MHIFWYGQFCFQILLTLGKGKQFSILCHPFSEQIGIRIPKLNPDILIGGDIKPSNSSTFLITGPGEYEIKEIYIEGIPAQNNNTIYTMEGEGMKICHLGSFSQKELSGEEMEKIGKTDILMIPIGGRETIDGREAAKIISQIEPSIVIPMHYQIPKLKIKLEGVDKFLKMMGRKSTPFQPKLLIKKKDLPQEETKIVVLKSVCQKK